MFIPPDSIPPGAEFILVALVPLGLLVFLKLPLLATMQLGILIGLGYAVIATVRRKGWPKQILVWLFPAVYVVGTFATNLWLLFLR
ncbi:MAG: hypothetical protein AAFX76_12120 [Planctomycetota bacterium]